jgi:hypothetical protein
MTNDQLGTLIVDSFVIAVVLVIGFFRKRSLKVSFNQTAYPYVAGYFVFHALATVVFHR